MSNSYYLLARERADGHAVELRFLGQFPEASPAKVAAVASNMGFDLMYECNAEPDMALAAELAGRNRLSTMDCVIKLWVLHDKI